MKYAETTRTIQTRPSDREDAGTNGGIAILIPLVFTSTVLGGPVPKDITRCDPHISYRVELSKDSPVGEASIREHAIAWHPGKRKYYLVADVVPLKNPFHPNSYDTQIHLWSSPDLTQWTYHGVAVQKGVPGKTYDGYGVASPAGLAYQDGKLYVPFSARKTAKFTERGIGLAWSGSNPETVPWTKTETPISDLPGEDDDPAVVAVPGRKGLHCFHRRTGPGGYSIVHTFSPTPEVADSWSLAMLVTDRPGTVRAQELTAAFFLDDAFHLFVIEHLTAGGMPIAHLVSEKAEGPFVPIENTPRYLGRNDQPSGIVYSGHITSVVREDRVQAFFWTVQQAGLRYGLLGHPALYQ